MRPFNLQEAIQGKPLVTRNGKKVTDFHYFKDLNMYPIKAVLDNIPCIESYTENGTWYSNQETERDLFMFEEPKTYYANVFSSVYSGIVLGAFYASKKEAEECSKASAVFIKTIEITIP